MVVTPLYQRFERIRDKDLRPEEVLRFSNGRWRNLAETEKAFRRIRRRYLTEQEKELLVLLAMNPSKSDNQIGEILGSPKNSILAKRRRLCDMIASYGWWIQNEIHIRRTVRKRLTPFHLRVFLPVIHRRSLRQISEDLEITRWCAYKKMDDCIVLLDRVPDFLDFLRSLKLGYNR